MKSDLEPFAPDQPLEGDQPVKEDEQEPDPAVAVTQWFNDTRWELRIPGQWWDQLVDTVFTDTVAEVSSLTPQALRIIFDELAAEWRRDTKGESFPHRKAMHFAYQQIIGLGPDALPLILQSLETDLGDWFWALVAITRIDVAEGISNVDEAAQRWIEWGKATRHVSVIA